MTAPATPRKSKRSPDKDFAGGFFEKGLLKSVEQITKRDDRSQTWAIEQGLKLFVKKFARR